MRIRKDKKTNSGKKVAIVIVILLLLAGGYATLAYNKHFWPFPQSSSTQTSNNAVDPNTATQIKSDSVNSNADKSTSGSDTPTGTTTDPATGTSGVEVDLTHYGANGTLYSIRFDIQAQLASGTCTLKLTPTSGAIYTATAGIQPLSTTSTCQGFDINKTDLHEGTYTLDLSLTSGTTIGHLSQRIQVGFENTP